MTEHNIDVALINEMHLRRCNRLNIPNYQTYKKDRGQQAAGGVAIIIKRNLKHHELPEVDTTENKETIGIEIMTADGPMALYSLYSPPNKEMNTPDLDKIFRNNTATIAAGDFNAKHTHSGTAEKQIKKEEN